MTNERKDGGLVTKEDIDRELLTLPPTLTGKAVRALLGRLLAERDAAVRVAVKFWVTEHGLSDPATNQIDGYGRVLEEIKALLLGGEKK
jgi:hypothetical protein